VACRDVLGAESVLAHHPVTVSLEGPTSGHGWLIKIIIIPSNLVTDSLACFKRVCHLEFSVTDDPFNPRVY